ncbi:MAG: beta-ketoacyl synthase chain length factor [Campylobacterota bacterium]
MKVNVTIIDAAKIYAQDTPGDLNMKQLVPKMLLRRRLTDLAKLSVALCDAVGFTGGRIVYGSAYGELAPTARMLNDMYAHNAMSPTDFQNSVYNTAISYLSLLQQNREELVTVSSGDETSDAILHVGGTKALDGDEILLLGAEAINIEGIETRNTCTSYLQSAVALRVRASSEKSDIDWDEYAAKDWKEFIPSLRKMFFLARQFEQGKKTFEVLL